MPSKKKKYNARFPAGRIKKIMQTDEEVGKVAQAVPIIISRTLELFVESLLTKAMQVTSGRNAKTLSPSHVKQCIQGESRFDFLMDLVKNIPDVSAAEEKEMMSAGSSPNSSRSEPAVAPRRMVRENSNTSTSSESRIQVLQHLQQRLQDPLKRSHSFDPETSSNASVQRTDKPPATIVSADTVIDLSVKPDRTRITDVPPLRRVPNFYQETLTDVSDTAETPHGGVIRVNPTYASQPQPSTSQHAGVTPGRLKPPLPGLIRPEHIPYRQNKPVLNLDLMKPHLNNNTSNAKTTILPRTPITPILNIDFTKNISRPEFQVLSASAVPQNDSTPSPVPKISDPLRQGVSLKYSTKSIGRSSSYEARSRHEAKAPAAILSPIDIDHLNSGNLEIDEDYDT